MQEILHFLECRTDRDKDRLGFIMAYGEDIKDPDPKKVIERANKKTPEEQDRFEECELSLVYFILVHMVFL